LSDDSHLGLVTPPETPLMDVTFILLLAAGAFCITVGIVLYKAKRKSA
jgi:hypothetical protein